MLWGLGGEADALSANQCCGLDAVHARRVGALGERQMSVNFTCRSPTIAAARLRLESKGL